MANIQECTNELHEAFRRLNADFFNNELPVPAITIQPSGKRKAMGWCSSREVWGNKEGNIKLYEINISAEYLDIEFMETMDTMLHEMVHLYNAVHGIKDTSRGGTYHNKRFKLEAERRGFYFPEGKPHPVYGWYMPRLKEETKEKIRRLRIREDVFIISRRGAAALSQDETDPEEAEEKKPTSFKWVCPGCEIIVRSTKKEIHIKCGECNLRMEIEE